MSHKIAETFMTAESFYEAIIFSFLRLFAYLLGQKYLRDRNTLNFSWKIIFRLSWSSVVRHHKS